MQQDVGVDELPSPTSICFPLTQESAPSSIPFHPNFNVNPLHPILPFGTDFADQLMIQGTKWDSPTWGFNHLPHTFTTRNI